MLKYLHVVIFLLLIPRFYGQFADDFTDGDFTTGNLWAGDDAKFIVNGSGELQLSAPSETSDAYLAIACPAIENAEWEFFVRMDFNPSSSNYTQIFLVSDSDDLRNGLNGYFVYIGGTTDEISLFRQTGNTRTRIIQGVAGSVNTSPVNVRIRVSRDIAGNWELFRDTSLTGVFVSEGSVFDDAHLYSSFFGVYCDYTATRSEHFYFDDFIVTGQPYTDLIAPEFVSLTVTSQNTIDLLFNEALDEISVESNAGYTVNNAVGSPISVELDPVNNALIHLTFATDFIDGAMHELVVSGIADPAGNVIAPFAEEFFFYIANEPSWGDIRINEVMADESPSVGQPVTEYVELLNTTAKTFDLTGWKICNDNSCGTIQSVLLLPHSYLLVTPTGALDSFPGKPIINATSFPGLKNSADEIFLWDATETILIDNMIYSLATYQDSEKSDGGYSLELINPLLPCSGSTNWTASASVSGGTPGEQNSVYTTTPDSTPPAIESAFAESENKVRITFTELMDSVDLVNLGLTIAPLVALDSIKVEQRYSYVMDIYLSEPLVPSVIYSLELMAVEDCSGNITDLSTVFVLPSLPFEGDVVINEILFNPLTGGSDYIELLNVSDKTFDLKYWQMANYTDTISGFKLIAEVPFLFSPGQYLVLTKDSLQVKQAYPAHGFGTFIYCDLPAYSNGEGSVLLLDDSGGIIDRVDYLEDWHFRLLDDKKGKSLERISSSGKSNDASNWQTASETIGFGTPGLKNSQNFEANADGGFSVEPKVFSPDNDGFEDFVMLVYDLPEPGMVGSIHMYDENGRKVRTLVNNHYFDQRGELKWDGLNEDEQKCPTGRYIVVFEVYSPTGTAQNISARKVVVVASRL